MADQQFKQPVHGSDPLILITRLLNKANTLWLKMTYPFAAFGSQVSIDRTCVINRPYADRIHIGDRVYVAEDVWFNIVRGSQSDVPSIILGSGTGIGRRCVFTTKNQIRLDEDVTLGPAILLADHAHEFSDVNVPIGAQGTTPGGTILIERGCWLGYGAAVISNSGELVIGRNSVIGACSVVTRSIPPYSVVVGNPAKIVKQFDPVANKWITPGPAQDHRPAEAVSEPSPR